MKVSPGAFDNLVGDARFEVLVAKGNLDVAAIEEALHAARYELWMARFDGRGRDHNRLRLLTEREARPEEYRKVRRLFAALYGLMNDDIFREPSPAERARGLTKVREEGMKNIASWSFSTKGVAQHARALLEALWRAYPALALDYPGGPGAPLTRRESRDDSALIQKRTRAALARAGLRGRHLQTALMRAAGLTR